MIHNLSASKWSTLTRGRAFALGADLYALETNFPASLAHQLAASTHDDQFSPVIAAFVEKIARVGRLALARSAKVSIHHIERVINESEDPDVRLIAVLEMEMEGELREC